MSRRAPPFCFRILLSMTRRFKSGLVVFGYFTAVGLSLFGYRYLEFVANRETVPPLEPFINEVVTGAWMAALLFPFDRHVRAVQLEGTLAQARLENLRLQLQPHFLFNALNTISSVVYEDPRKADAMIAALSDLLRTTINDSEAQVVPIDREIETVERYLSLMRQRFEDKLHVDVRVEPDVQRALVPHLL